MQIGKWRNSVIARIFVLLRGRQFSSRTALALIVLCGVSSACLGFAWVSVEVPRFEEVKSNYKTSDVWIVDRNGTALESIRTQNNHRTLDWIAWSEVSAAFRELVVHVEDRRFYSHWGVDVWAMAKASWERLAYSSKRGASTLTMQLVSLLQSDSAIKRKSLLQKIQQTFLALKLTTQWTKEQTLEAYINLAPFRGELVGLRAASMGYFGKAPSALVREESALLVALLRSPNARASQVAQRACRILSLNNCRPIEHISQQVFSKPYRVARARQIVPVLSNFIIENQNHPSIIQTSLDANIQRLALTALQEQLRSLKNQNVNDGAALVIETQTGRVVAYVANTGLGMSSAEQIDGVQMLRQAGSTIKPFVYGTTFDWNFLSANSLLDDSPADIAVGSSRVYHPRNYDQVFRGLVSVGEALGSSMNVPAVRALQLVGERRVLERLRQVGFSHLEDDEYYGPSMALGAMDVSLWELTQGYRRLAIDASPFSATTRERLFNILSAPEYRRFTFGMDSLLTLPFAAAVKTGTSKDMRDNWCIGWTPQYTVGVWVGNFDGKPMWNVSGMTGAAPVWRSLMLALHPHAGERVLNAKFEEPVYGQYQEPSKPLLRRTLSRIRYPAAEMLVGIDPDIPISVQKLPIEVENPQIGQKLFINNHALGKAQETLFWSLQRGKYQVELKSASGELVDSVHFEVR